MKGAGTTHPGTGEPEVQHSLPRAIAALLWGSDSADSDTPVSNRSPHDSWHSEGDEPKATERKCGAWKTASVLFPASTAVSCSG